MAVFVSERSRASGLETVSNDPLASESEDSLCRDDITAHFNSSKHANLSHSPSSAMTPSYDRSRCLDSSHVLDSDSISSASNAGDHMTSWTQSSEYPSSTASDYESTSNEQYTVISSSLQPGQQSEDLRSNDLTTKPIQQTDKHDNIQSELHLVKDESIVAQYKEVRLGEVQPGKVQLGEVQSEEVQSEEVQSEEVQSEGAQSWQESGSHELMSKLDAIIKNKTTSSIRPEFFFNESADSPVNCSSSKNACLQYHVFLNIHISRCC